MIRTTELRRVNQVVSTRPLVDPVESRFALGVLPVEHLKATRIKESLDRLCKRDSVLSDICGLFRGIPFKLHGSIYHTYMYITI
jgi:hypothetical protein